MRVISGKYKKSTLLTIKGNTTRPTSDRVKENIFNIIQEELIDASVADFFSGSGSLGIEALSRGAKFVTFIEKNFEAIQNIKKNIEKLKIESHFFSVIEHDVSWFLKQQKMVQKKEFDIIIADPPYESNWYEHAIEEIESANVCKKNCLAIFEMPFDKKMPEIHTIKSVLNTWICEDSRKYGKTRIEFWRRNP